MQIANMYSFLKHDLEDIENRLTEVVAADHRILHEASLQLLRAGGKRIRPVFVLLAAQFGNYRDNIEQVKSIAVALELIHMARSEEHTSELQSRGQLVCRLLLE